MTAPKFISEIISHYTTVLLTRTRLPISLEICNQLSSKKNLKVLIYDNPNSEPVPELGANIIVHFAGFEPNSLAETLYHTSTLHRLMDYAIVSRGKLIFVIPEGDTHHQQTAIQLLSQFQKNFGLEYKIISLPETDDIGLAAQEIIRTFIKNHIRPTLVPTDLEAPPVQKPKRPTYWPLLLLVLVPTFPWFFYLTTIVWSLGFATCSLKSLGSGAYTVARYCGRLTQFSANFAQIQSHWVWSSEKFVSHHLYKSIVRVGDIAQDIGSFNFSDSEKVLDQLSYLESDLVQLAKAWPKLGVAISGIRDNLAATKSLLYKYSLVSGHIAEIANSDKYLVLVMMQDSSLVRATGGYLEKLALISLERGQVVSIKYLNPAEIGAQLRGQVEPPLSYQIADGESEWYLHEANWSPDFPTSARQVSWFLEKTLDQKVDLVIGANQKVLNELSFLMGQTDSNGQLGWLMGDFKSNLDKGILYIAQNLDSRQVMVEAVSTANMGWKAAEWNGAVGMPVCAESDCLADLTYVIDSHVANSGPVSDLDLNYSLDIKLNQRKVDYHYRLKYMNRGDHLKNYLRMIVPGDMQFSQVRLNGAIVPASQYLVSSEHGMLSIGLLLSISAQSEYNIEIISHRRVVLEKYSSYELVFQNQPGQRAVPTHINVDYGTGLDYNTDLLAPYRIKVDL